MNTTNKAYTPFGPHKALRLNEPGRIDTATKNAATTEQLEDVVESAKKQLAQERLARGIETKRAHTTAEEETDVEA